VKRKVKIDVVSMRCIHDTLDSNLTSLKALTLVLVAVTTVSMVGGLSVCLVVRGPLAADVIPPSPLNHAPILLIVSNHAPHTYHHSISRETLFIQAHLHQISKYQHPHHLPSTNTQVNPKTSYCATLTMPYKSRTPLEAQSSKWHRSRSSLAGTASEPASSKRKADKLGNKDDRPRKRARNEEDQYEYEYEYEMDLDQDLDLDEIRMAQVGQEEERWIAVDEYGLPLLGFAPSDDSASSFVGLSRYAIDVESIVRQGFGDGSDTSIGVDLYSRFRPCGAIVSENTSTE
jgi:hypothetical protein